MAKPRRRKPQYQRDEEERARIAAEAVASKKRIPADPAQMVIPANSYFIPPEFYEDMEFTCRGCGVREVWTAADQKWWYEVAKGSIYSAAVLCGACRQARRQAHRGTPRRSHAQRRDADGA
jgi:hypothetical protein